MTASEEPETTEDDAPAEVDKRLQQYFADLPQANQELLSEIFGGERTTTLTAEEVAERLGNQILDADLSRFSENGVGTIYGLQVQRLSPGQRIAVTDADGESDTVLAEVLSVDESTAEIRVFWDQVLRKA